ncbi:SDR family NAD(P)-dependent oxidoreductase [Nocardia wallacei]|uniref:SDR family NAD(P)-dependent oxidoreductase n=1 Tax=Nocardia wallacei TaxID=480035 RepID=UPI0024573EFB|nr:SDR family oxidoreductase [Nocardia wallacei]
MPGRLEGKTALVTGATSNIGRAIAVAFAAEGARVVVSGRDQTRGDKVIAEITGAGGKAVFIPANLDGTADTARTLAAQATNALGGAIDILVNNAGIFPATSTADTDEATFDQVYAVNVKTPFLLTGLIAPKMAERGSGAIINLGSWVARLGIPMASLYASTKGAMETLTRMWAAEYGPNGVRVNAISPGVIAENTGESPGTAMMRGTPANQSGTPNHIANAAIYLASDESTFVHGIVIDVDGGRTTTAVIANQPHTDREATRRVPTSDGTV